MRDNGQAASSLDRQHHMASGMDMHKAEERVWEQHSRHGAMPTGSWVPRYTGAPQGERVSMLLANTGTSALSSGGT